MDIVTNCVDYRLTILFFSNNHELIKKKSSPCLRFSVSGLIKRIFQPQNGVKFKINLAFPPYNSQIIFVVFFVMGKIRLHWLSFVHVTGHLMFHFPQYFITIILTFSSLRSSWSQALMGQMYIVSVSLFCLPYVFFRKILSCNYEEIS